MKGGSSLRVALIRRLALSLATIGIFGAVFAYVLGANYATLAYDRAQADDVMVLASQITITDAQLQLNLPSSALPWLLTDEGEEVFYRVTEIDNGRVLASNGDLGPPPSLAKGGNPIDFRDIEVGSRRLRVVSLRYTVDPLDVPVLVQIGETTGHRDRVIEGILSATVLFLLILIAVAVGLVWQGVGSALAPLDELEAEAAKRSGADLTPLDPQHAPAEVRGLILAINRMMLRVSSMITSQSHFIANAAHQLRTPLAGLRLQAQLGLKSRAPERMEESLVEVARSATRATHLVEQLLVLAKAETADPVADVGPVDLAQIGLEVIERFLPAADGRGVDLGFGGDGGPAWVSGNAVLFGELLSNLVDNALRHGRTSGHVTLEVRRRDAEVIAAVQDDGPGLAESEQGDLFRRFYRGDEASRRDGAGLGLAIVHEIAQRFGGRIRSESAPGEGCRFEVAFPAVVLAG